MANFNFTTSSGGKFSLKDEDSQALGKALKASGQLLPGAVFKPETQADRDDFVAYLNSLDYTARSVEARLAHGDYQIVAAKTMTQDELDAWIAEERKLMAKRLGLADETLITVSTTAI